MDTREISTRLHDLLRVACRVGQPGPGRSAEANVESVDEVKAGLRALIADLGEQQAPRLPPRLKATAAAFPEGRIAGTRTTVQHHRRTRVRAIGAVRTEDAGRLAAAVPPTPRQAAEALFRRPDVGAALRLDRAPAEPVSAG
nr:hypothetical protein [Methylobacterium sp. L1A1]